MGMDVIGMNPTTTAGSYFGNNRWWWLPLANYIIKNGPEHLVSKVKNWKTNDGDGLDADDAAELAKWLREDLTSGAVKDYEQRRNQWIATLPKVKCEWCKGTGIRAGAESGYLNQMVENDGPRKDESSRCSACNGYGEHESLEASCGFSEQNVAEFATFLEGSGGFQIW
jgi:hypothetical protein